jgi:DNA-binding transcriptional MerR regulator
MRDPVTTSTAAQICSRSESTIKLWADRGVLPSLRLPTGIRIFERRDVERVARERQKQAAKDDAA